MRSGPNTDYYAVLGVNPDASGDELKTAFRTRAKTLHPDTQTGVAGGAEAFKLLNEAYGVLSDETKRRAYDGGSGSVRSSFNAGGAAPGSSFTSQEYGTASEEAQHAPHVQAWYVGQKEVSRHQEFFYEKTVASEQRGAARQIKAANAIKIIPQSRGRSMLWLATPVFIAALWGFNTMSARNTRKMHNR